MDSGKHFGSLKNHAACFKNAVELRIQEASQKMQKHKIVAFEVEASNKAEKIIFTRDESLGKLLCRMPEYP